MKSAKTKGMSRFAFHVALCSLFLFCLSLGLVIYVVPRLSSYDPVSKKATAALDILNMRAALENFSVYCGRYPTTADGLQALMVQPSGVSGWKGPYLEKGVPPDPWGNAYVYKCPGDHNQKTFDLCSFGPDGREGGGDDLDNWNNK